MRDDRDAAVSDIIGAILLVGLTVVMATAFGLLLFAYDGPSNSQHTNLAATVDPGQGSWGSGDESIRLTHLGGEPLRAVDASVTYRVGGVSTTLTGTALGSAFADGHLTVGETWVRTLAISLNAEVEVDVIVVEAAGASMLSSSTVVAGATGTANVCQADVTAPTVDASTGWLPTTADVNANTSGAVTVQATAQDNCIGLAASPAPSLQWRVTTTPTAAWPASPDSVTMTGGPSVWVGAIPAQAWGTLASAGNTLQYRVAGLQDLAVPPNVGTTAIRSDAIDLVFTYTYPASHSVTEGAVSDFGNLQSAGDSGATATLAAAASGSAGIDTQNANGVTVATGWSSATTGNLQGSNNQYATTNSNTPSYLQVQFGNPSASSNAISQVVLKAEVSITSYANDGWTLQACLGTAVCSSSSPVTSGFSSDSTLSYDVTALRPGGGTWSWADLTDLQARLQPIKSGGRDGTWQVDRMWFEASHVPTWSADITVDWPVVPAATTKVLEARYHTTGPGFLVEVWDGSAFNARGDTLSSATATTWSYTLTAAEAAANGGAPRIRFVDAVPGSTTQGTLLVDYLRIGRA